MYKYLTWMFWHTSDTHSKVWDRNVTKKKKYFTWIFSASFLCFSLKKESGTHIHADMSWTKGVKISFTLFDEFGKEKSKRIFVIYLMGPSKMSDI